MTKAIIGTIDFISFIEHEIENIPCKVDTGADTSAVYASKIKIKEKNGIEYLSFRLLGKRHLQYTGKEILVEKFMETKVKSSFGDYEFRYKVELKIKLMNKTYRAWFNLSNRENMKFPVLLGKRFLKGKFLVDVSQKNISQTL
jgi:hypothetical protein